MKKKKLIFVTCLLLFVIFCLVVYSIQPKEKEYFTMKYFCSEWTLTQGHSGLFDSALYFPLPKYDWVGQKERYIINCPQYKDGKYLSTFYLYGLRKGYPLKFIGKDKYKFYYKNNPLTKDWVIKNGITQLIVKKRRV